MKKIAEIEPPLRFQTCRHVFLSFCRTLWNDSTSAATPSIGEILFSALPARFKCYWAYLWGRSPFTRYARAKTHELSWLLLRLNSRYSRVSRLWTCGGFATVKKSTISGLGETIYGLQQHESRPKFCAGFKVYMEMGCKQWPPCQKSKAV